MAEDYGITYYLSAEDDRYPTLVIQGDFGSVGYALNKKFRGIEACMLVRRS